MKTNIEMQTREDSSSVKNSRLKEPEIPLTPYEKHKRIKPLCYHVTVGSCWYERSVARGLCCCQSPTPPPAPACPAGICLPRRSSLHITVNDTFMQLPKHTVFILILVFLILLRTRLPTVGDRAFPAAATRVWNSLPDFVTSVPSVAVFRSRLKTHLFNISYLCDCTVPAQWL